MQKYIQIPLPENISENAITTYEQNSSYKAYPLTPVRHQNTLVCRSGICIKNFKLVKDSVYGYRSLFGAWYTRGLYNLFFKKKQHLSSKNEYFIIHNIWCPGYAHWLLEAIPRLWVIRNEIGQSTLLAPIEYKSLVEETLMSFNLHAVKYIPKGINFTVPRLLLPANPLENFHISPEIYQQLRQHFYQYYKIDTMPSRKVYISRKKARARKVHNEESVLKLLEKYGFISVCFEDLNFEEQIRTMASTSHIISIHGAGLANLLFMKPQTKVLEFMNDFVLTSDVRKNAPNVRFLYYRLSAALGLKYYVQFCQPISEKEKFDTNDINVDITKLEDNVRLMIS